MAKGPGEQANKQATTTAANSTATTQSNIYGGPNSAFGPGGLSGNYQGTTNRAIGGYDKSYDTGGYDPTALSQIRNTSANYAITGGLDPTAQSAYQKLVTEGAPISQEASNAYKDTIAGGGLSPESSGLYKNFVATGGYSDADKQGILRQATSGVKGSFNTLANQAKLASARTGGYGGASAIASMGRGALQQQAETTTSALNDINAQVRANQLKGAAGLDEGTKNVLTAASGMTDQDKLRLEGQKIGGQGLLDQATLKNKALQTQQQTEADVSKNKLGYDQLMSYMSSDAGKQIMSMLGIDSSNQQQTGQLLYELSTRPGMFDNIMKVIGAGASIAGIPTGGGSGGGGTLLGDVMGL